MANEEKEPPPYTKIDLETNIKQKGVDNKAFDKSNEVVELDQRKLQYTEKEPDETETGTPWHELTPFRKFVRVSWVIIRVLLFLISLYFFFCSLGFLSSAFRLLGGKTAGEFFRNSELLSNPVCGVMIGVLATVLFQSSSTTTSVVVSMVGADVLGVMNAIPIVMGANIGTSVTNTIVSLGQITSKDDFRRAFAGATVHDMFNWLTVIVFLPIEAAFGYLFHLSTAIVDSMHLKENKDTKIDFLKAITKPFMKLIIEVNSKTVSNIAKGKDGGRILKTCCKSKTFDIYNTTTGINSTVKECVKKCKHIFVDTTLNDAEVGGIMLVVSIVLLFVCLFGIVKVLNSLLQGRIRTNIKKFVNFSFPGRWAYFTGYIAILVGTAFTIIVQSSSIFTSTLTPLVGMGVINLDRMYPLTLGSNIGTTTTGMLAALATPTDGGVENLKHALQVAFCHLFFNLSGIILWYPIPFLRFPIPMAEFLGKETAKYRWYAILYLIFMFGIFPLIVFALSLAGVAALAGVGIPIVVIIIVIGIIKTLQKKKPEVLPNKLQNWKFLPLCFRSLSPVDYAISRTCFCCKVCRQNEEPVPEGAMSNNQTDKETTQM